VAVAMVDAHSHHDLTQLTADAHTTPPYTRNQHRHAHNLRTINEDVIGTLQPMPTQSTNTRPSRPYQTR